MVAKPERIVMAIILSIVSSAHGQCTQGSWQTQPSMPGPLQEIASATVNNKMYVMSASVTYVYNFNTNSWTQSASNRPKSGDHYHAIAVGTRIFLIGGFGGARGEVQIFDTFRGTWSLGPSMPWSAFGSVSAALLHGEIHACGGLRDGSTTVNTLYNPEDCFRLNPTTLLWTRFSSMIRGVDHAASATDGEHFFVFGGRDSGRNRPDQGIDLCQKYTYSTDTWVECAPMPFARSGMGRAVFWNGKMLVMGGESSVRDSFMNNRGTYPQVSVYSIETDSWSLGEYDNMPNGRHGADPVIYNGAVWVAGGASTTGNAAVSWHHKLCLPPAAPVASRAPTQPGSPTIALPPLVQDTGCSTLAVSTVDAVCRDECNAITLGRCTCAFATSNIPRSGSCTTVCSGIGMTCIGRHRDGRSNNPCRHFNSGRFAEQCGETGDDDDVCICSKAYVERTRPPSTAPSHAPSAVPTSFPTDVPTASPTAHPSPAPTLAPSGSPTVIPSASPSTVPTRLPSAQPSARPTTAPTADPTAHPSARPTFAPTFTPTVSPSHAPTLYPTVAPSASPTTIPTASPTSEPSESPSSAPSSRPTSAPTANPTVSPTLVPTEVPTPSPSAFPTALPTVLPSAGPTAIPSVHPTARPTSTPTVVPTATPTASPTAPTAPTEAPTANPTIMPSVSPTAEPTTSPTALPTATPTLSPSAAPSVNPTGSPTATPTFQPSALPTAAPTAPTAPTEAPTGAPTVSPSASPTIHPTPLPSQFPTVSPSGIPTTIPSASPTATPSSTPSKAPTAPTASPTAQPTAQPTEQPTASPTSSPSVIPTGSPTVVPTLAPSASPSSTPTQAPSSNPTLLPSANPTTMPSISPTALPTAMPTVNPTTAPVPTVFVTGCSTVILGGGDDVLCLNECNTITLGLCTCAFALRGIPPGGSCTTVCAGYSMTCTGRHSDAGSANRCAFFDQGSKQEDCSATGDDDDVCICSKPSDGSV
eukprot:m.69204 g.69204  ORF g.69204 m.69204 type:complete len:981 (-) comp9957_c0_seq1:6587-9529(-)